jgi:hypothetical protein
MPHPRGLLRQQTSLQEGVHKRIILLIVKIGCAADHVAIAKGGTKNHRPSAIQKGQKVLTGPVAE